MLVGNKSDRVTEREVSIKDGSALAKELGCDFVETSAQNCTNVEKAFYDVIRQLRLQDVKQEEGSSEGRMGQVTKQDRREKGRDGRCVIL
jgi:GTPase KRas protein